MKVAIHQPDMMPWLGFFIKICKADLWVVLDHVENNPRDANFWGRRVKILVNGKPHWLSLPLKRPKDGRIGIPIRNMYYNDALTSAYYDALKTIEYSYKRAIYFKEVFYIVRDFILSKNYNLVERNMDFILKIFKLLDINPLIIYSSELDCKEKSTALLLEILKKVGAKTYICGEGARAYQDDNLILNEGIKIIYNKFEHPVYNQVQSRSFYSGLSIIDILMNKGIEETKKIIHNEKN